MSDPILTTQERAEFRSAVEVLIGYHVALGIKPCFFLFTAVTGWDRMYAVCACEYPRYEVRSPS